MYRRRRQEVIKTEISGATIRSTSKRRTTMKVLMLLNRESMPHTITEISEELDMDWSTVKHNLLKLKECQFIENVEDKMDTRTRYFQVVNKEATEKEISDLEKVIDNYRQIIESNERTIKRYELISELSERE